jgi:PAS domain S-box-containing protein
MIKVSPDGAGAPEGDLSTSNPATGASLFAVRSKLWGVILETALDAVIVMDIDGCVVDWNNGARETFGWTKDEAVGRIMSELIIPSELREAHWRGLQRFIRTGREEVVGRRMEISGLRKSGEIFPVELSISVVADETDIVFLGFLRDLSAHKHAEEELRKTEERFSKAFNSAAHPMSITTLKEGRYVDINAAGLAASGKTREEVIGRTIRDLGFYDDPDNETKVRELLAKEGQFKDLETTLKSPRGARLFLLSGALVELHGEPCLFTSAVDITERKRAEEHLKLVMGEMNHRANNLLTIVLALVQQTGKSYGAEQIAGHISERIKGLTASNDLLVSGNWRGAELAKLVNSQLSHFSDMAAQITATGPYVRLDAAATQAVGMALHELLTNAIKHGALSVARGTITLEWSITGDGDKRMFHMIWRERDGPVVSDPHRTGFGRTVIEGMVREALQGDAVLRFEREGVVWRLDCPAGKAFGA